jgi:hypothetical protein
MIKWETLPPADVLVLRIVTLVQRNRGIEVMSPNVTIEWAALLLRNRVQIPTPVTSILSGISCGIPSKVPEHILLAIPVADRKIPCQTYSKKLRAENDTQSFYILYCIFSFGAKHFPIHPEV